MEQINYSLIFISQNRSQSPGKRWGIAVNPSNRRRENCTFLHVLQVLVPSADPLSVAQDSRRDLLGGCGDTWHGILNLVRRGGAAPLFPSSLVKRGIIIFSFLTSAKALMEGGMTIPGTTGVGVSGSTGVFACNNKSIYICDSLRRKKSFKQSVARELSAMLFQFRGSCNRKDQLLENPWKALGESHGRKVALSKAQRWAPGELILSSQLLSSSKKTSLFSLQRAQ
ncbi:unnamed protein product [Bubo scandiacus]